MDEPEARDLQAKSIRDAFWVIANFEYDFKEGDILINEANTSEAYRVFAIVRKYPGHAEIPVELIAEHERQSLSIIGKPSLKVEDRQQNIADKKLASSPRMGVLFQNFVHDLLENLGFRVVSEPRIHNAQADFLAYSPIKSLDGVIREQKLIVEVKYRNLGGRLSSDILNQVAAYAHKFKADKALLITNFPPTSEEKKFNIYGKELEVWDANKLYTLLEGFPELKQKYLEIVSQLELAIHTPEKSVDKTLSDQNELIKALRNMPKGDGKAYEELVKTILEFCFCDEFNPFKIKEQVPTENKKRIRDFIIDNRNPKTEFWQFLKFCKGVEKILFDAKNYKDPVEYAEITSTLRYLRNKAFGNFIIIISRHGVKDYEETVEDYSDVGRVILYLSDEDLIAMINMKREGKSPTFLIEDKYYDFLDKK